MTTVAYRDGIVAADSRTHIGDWIVPGATEKLVRVDGKVIAQIGDMAVCAAILGWIDRPEGPQPTGNATVVVFCGGEVFIHSDGGMVIEQHDRPFMAWGTGAPVAFGAMYAGADAETAVRIACDVDLYSGAPVMAMRVEQASGA